MNNQVYILNENELMHHGVLGMKWGIRRYQPYSQVPRGSGKTGKEIGEASGKKTKLGRKVHYGVKNYKDMIEKAGNAQGPGNILGELVGHKSMVTRMNNEQKYREENAAAAKTKIGKRRNEQKAANANYRKQYHEMASERDLGEHLKSGLIFDQDMWNMPYERYSGRTTTVGKEILSDYLTLGIAGFIADREYKKEQKQKKH